MKFETTVITTIPSDIVGVMATITVSDSVPDTSTVAVALAAVMTETTSTLLPVRFLEICIFVYLGLHVCVSVRAHPQP